MSITRESIWNLYVKRNPCLASATSVRLPTAQLRRMVEQAWDLATKAAGESWRSPGGNGMSVEDLPEFLRDALGRG
jgi:hypothetical protein